MAKRCSICDNEIEDENGGKIKGTIVKVLENGKNRLIYVCSSCQSEEPEKYVEKAKVKSA
jgi:uncharacterized protein with PIN domain